MTDQTPPRAPSGRADAPRVALPSRKRELRDLHAHPHLVAYVAKRTRRTYRALLAHGVDRWEARFVAREIGDAADMACTGYTPAARAEAILARVLEDDAERRRQSNCERCPNEGPCEYCGRPCSHVWTWTYDSGPAMHCEHCGTRKPYDGDEEPDANDEGPEPLDFGPPGSGAVIIEYEDDGGLWDDLGRDDA